MPERNVGGVGHPVRALLAVTPTVVAVAAHRAGNQSVVAVAALGALGAGFNATICFCGPNTTLGIDTTENED